MSSPVVKKFIRKQRAEPTTPQGSTRAAAPTRLELFTPVYTTDQYGVKGTPTKQMMAKVCGPYQQREKLHELMTKFAGRNAYIVAKFKSPLPKSEQHYQMPQISPEADVDARVVVRTRHVDVVRRDRLRRQRTRFYLFGPRSYVTFFYLLRLVFTAVICYIFTKIFWRVTREQLLERVAQQLHPYDCS